MENEATLFDLVIADLKAASEPYEHLIPYVEDDCRDEKSSEKRGRLYAFFFHISFIKNTLDRFICELNLYKEGDRTYESLRSYILEYRNEFEKSSRIEPSDEISMAERYVASLLDSIHTKRFDDMLPF